MFGSSSAMARDRDAARSAFDTARSAFDSGDFAAAISGYQQAINAWGGTSDMLAFQMASAQMHSGKTGEAALWFSRALAANPSFSEARQNLSAIAHRTGALKFEPGWAAGLNRAISPYLTAFVAVLLVWIAAITLVLSLRRSHAAGASLQGAQFVLPAFLVLIGLGLWFGLYNAQVRASSNGLGNAVVIAKEAAAHASPSPDAARFVELPAGSQVRIEQTRGPWCYVEIPGDLHGWVQADRVALIAMP